MSVEVARSCPTSRRTRCFLTLGAVGVALGVLGSVGCGSGSDVAAPSGPGGGSSNAAGAGSALSGSAGTNAAGASAGSANSGAGTAGALSAAGGGTAGAGTAGAGGASSTGSAGASGSGGTGGGAGAAGAANCVTAGSELCETFESGALDARWTQSKSGSTSITVETGKAHSGQYAVHLKFVAGQQSTVTISESATFPATPNKFYSRMFAYFGPDIPKAASGDFHTGFMVGGGKNDKGDVTVGMGMIGSDQQYLGYSIFFGNPKYEFGPWSNPRIVANQWQCIELLEDGSDPTTEVRKVWLNDVEMKELESDSAKAGGSANPNHLPPKFEKVTFGVIEYHPIPTLAEMWIDDIRVSAQKIGCAN